MSAAAPKTGSVPDSSRLFARCNRGRGLLWCRLGRSPCRFDGRCVGIVRGLLGDFAWAYGFYAGRRHDSRQAFRGDAQVLASADLVFDASGSVVKDRHGLTQPGGSFDGTIRVVRFAGERQQSWSR